jgi:hypothetical protein
MNPYLQDILHNITTRLAKLEEVQVKKEWVGLTEDEVDQYFKDEWYSYSSYHNCFKEIMRWQEAKLKEKNGG